MRLLFIDIDTLRPDHLGCYGYERNTSPNIDLIAEESMRFDNYYCSDAPCLPSRAALVTGQFGIHNGVVGHGGTAADLRLLGPERRMADQRMEEGLFWRLRKAGFYTASFSSFSERHSAYWFYAGLNEVHNVGKKGNERADEVMDGVQKWLEEYSEKDNWFLHVHLWDPHTPYRTPEDLNQLFEKDPMPEWLTKEVINQHLKHVGPHSLNELNGFESALPEHWKEFTGHPGSATTYPEVKHLMDLYDCGVFYADQAIGKMTDILKKNGIYEDTAIIITSDHGETMGELGVYAEHGTCDELTCHIPMLIKWPGMKTGVDKELRYQIDFLPTIAELFQQKKSDLWDGNSYAPVLLGKEKKGYEYLVMTQCAHVCQRAVRFGNYLYIRTYHDGMHEFPREMLFDLEEDPHEQVNLAEKKILETAQGARYLSIWEQDQMKKSPLDVDPLWTVMREKGPFHTWKCDGVRYSQRLADTGREEGAVSLRKRHPELFCRRDESK
ncbi:MAG: sulfatase [Candidatus Limivivens sp.]|nr:sulfatase [Candidatus Limivivens sp.]